MRKGTHLGFRQVLFLVELPFQLVLQDKGRYQHGYERGEEDLGDDTLRSDDTFNPQHDGGNVADGRECTTRVGRDYHQGSIDQTFLTLLYQLPQHHNHHNRSGEVVEDGRQEEGHEGNTPHQFPLGACLDGVSYEVETTIRVDNLHDGHSTHQEEQGGGSIT